MEAHLTPNPYFFNYENVLPALHLLLYQATKDPAYRFAAQDFVRAWMTDTKATTGDIFYTRKYLAKAQPGAPCSRRPMLHFMSCWQLKKTCSVASSCCTPVGPVIGVGYMLGDAGRWVQRCCRLLLRS